jgi:hydrogenase maturation protease
VTGTGAGGVLVVGYGNVLRADDGVGWAVAGRVAGDKRLRGADVRAVHQLTPDLALDVSRASLVVLVDATTEGEAGSVAVRRLHDAVEAGSTWSHHLEPASVVALARELWGVAPPVFVVSVGAASLDTGDRLSPAVEAALPRAVDAVAAIVAEHRRA